MKHIKPMTREEFANRLLTLTEGEILEFACDGGAGWPNRNPEIGELECWYFAMRMSIPNYDSNFILIDYCGGEECFAIPLNCYSSKPDEDDRRIVRSYVDRFFEDCRNLGSNCTHIFVETDAPQVYNVLFEQIVRKTISVEAESKENAYDIAQNMYDEGEIDMDKDLDSCALWQIQVLDN